MKKIFSYAFIAAVAVALASCGNKTKEGAAADSTSVDSVKTEEVAKDPSVIDTEEFTMKIPDGWKKNGEESKHQGNLTTTDHVPSYYMNVEVEDYIESIDEWKSNLSKELKADESIKVGDKTFTILSKKDSFYKVYGATLLDGDKGALVFDFTGSGDKDIKEQRDFIQQVLEAVELK